MITNYKSQTTNRKNKNEKQTTNISSLAVTTPKSRSITENKYSTIKKIDI